MKEVEVKIRVKNLDKIEKYLTGLGAKLDKQVRQEDTVFRHKSERSIDKKPGIVVLRLRKQNGKTIFTLKKELSHELDNIEKEFDVSDFQNAKDSLGLMNYVVVVEVRKNRKQYKYKDFTICLDKVDGLGEFIEVEILIEGSSKRAEKKILDFIKELDVDLSGRTMKGYDTLILNK